MVIITLIAVISTVAAVPVDNVHGVSLERRCSLPLTVRAVSFYYLHD